MPNVTTYIRKDDMQLWLSVANKSELIHNALHTMPYVTTELSQAPSQPVTWKNEPYPPTMGRIAPTPPEAAYEPVYIPEENI